MLDDVVEAVADRRAAGDRALETWIGPRAEELELRLDIEVQASEEIGRALRAEADRWARAWADAVETARRAEPGSWETVASLDVATRWTPVPAPVGPGYEPTTIPGGWWP